MPSHHDQVVRLYDAVFDRAPDPEGLAFWTAHMDNGWSLHRVSGLFITAEEFGLTYGQPDNRSFVHSLYENVLDRPGEALGVEGWTRWLDSGTMDRASVVAGFSESQEHILQMRAAAEAQASPPAPPSAGEPVPQPEPAPAPVSSPGVVQSPNHPESYGTPGNDTIHGGEGYDNAIGFDGDDAIFGQGGNDLLVGAAGNDTVHGGEGDDIVNGGPGNDLLHGGPGDDTFVFRPGDGYDTIADFQPGDRIRLLDVAADDIGLIRPKGDITPPSDPVDAIDLVYARSLPGAGQGIVRLNGLDNADFEWARDAVIFG